MLVDVGGVPVTGVTVLAQDPAPPPGEGPEFGKASPVALLIVIILGLALIVLLRSMNKHLRRVPGSFEPATKEAPPQETPQQEKPQAPEQG